MEGMLMDLIPLLVGLITADDEDAKARLDAIDEFIEPLIEYDEDAETEER